MPLEVGDALAGQAVQCPRCRRLTDVPASAEEAAALLDDGTVALAKAGAKARSIFRPDDRNERFTLGYASADLTQGRILPSSLPPVESSHRTGEALGVRMNAAPRDPLAYRQDLAQLKHPFLSLPIELFNPANMIVMGVVFVALLFVPLLGLLTYGGAFPLALFAIVLLVIYVAHYVVVVTRTGPEEESELPTPLAEISLMEDVLRPLGHLLTALAISFGPSLLGFIYGGWDWRHPLCIAAVALLPVAVLCFPAVLLTVIAGVTPLNLAPHRLMKVIALGGVPYLFAALVLLPLVVVLHVGTWIAFYEAILSGFDRSLFYAVGTTSLMLSLPIAAAFLTLSVYVGHLLPFWVGRIYRLHHEAYPWLLQRHEKTPPQPKPATAGK